MKFIDDIKDSIVKYSTAFMPGIPEEDIRGAIERWENNEPAVTSTDHSIFGVCMNVKREIMGEDY